MAESGQHSKIYERVCEIFKIPCLYPEQIEAIEAILNKKSVYASLPTGYGKSMVYYALPIVYDAKIHNANKSMVYYALPIVYDAKIHNSNNSSQVSQPTSKVIIISPLQSLMEDQVQYLKSVGLTAIAIHDEQGEDTLNKVEEGQYTYLFASPEKMLKSDRWRGLLSSDVYRKSLISVVVDEAHCISQWGLPGSSKSTCLPFRVWYSNLGELRSLISSTVPSVVLTATASTSTKRDIFKTLNLDMKSVVVIERSPEKPNIRFDVQYVENKTPLDQDTCFDQSIRHML